jgi:hypothetical protein
MEKPISATTSSKGVPSWCLNHSLERATARFPSADLFVFQRRHGQSVGNGIQYGFQQTGYSGKLGGRETVDQVVYAC